VVQVAREREQQGLEEEVAKVLSQLESNEQIPWLPKRFHHQQMGQPREFCWLFPKS
jgi:hypothetical protein